MFKKLKDKIAEEVKISPQRIQQFTQSVTDKLQSNGNDENVFSITEDDGSQIHPAEPEQGFTNVSLHASSSSSLVEPRVRRGSNSSMASDVSFLPRYEPSINTYHLQSDLDASASELEDNASSSSQLGHVSKEQVYSAFQKAQVRYHKYRGRYTDLANHYKELERENAKMKAVLVETQDKAIRRASELREQCTLSQRAKADLEHSMRTEIEEKQIIISTLKDKVDLLQNCEASARLVEVDSSETDALKQKIQELKASGIVLQSKDADHREKLAALEKLLAENRAETTALEERERANNLKFAKSKLELHTELQNRDLEIAELKRDLEAHDGKPGQGLKAQNTKLIEKCEALSAKCQGYEAELVKTEQYKLEIAELQRERSEMRRESEDVRAKMETLVEGNAAKEAAIAAKETAIAAKEAAIADADETVAASRAEIERCKAEIDEARRVANEAEAKLLKKIDENNNLVDALRESDNNFKEMEKANDHLFRTLQEATKGAEEIETLRLKLNEFKCRAEEQEHLLKTETQKNIDEREQIKEETKRSLLSLESRIEEKLRANFKQEEDLLRADFERKLTELEANGEDGKRTQILLMQSEDRATELASALENIRRELATRTASYRDLETNHLGLIEENNGREVEIAWLRKENVDKVGSDRKLSEAVAEKERLQADIKEERGENFKLKQDYVNLSKDLSKLSSENTSLLGKLEGARREVEKLSGVRDALQADYVKSCAKIAKHEDEYKDLRERIESLLEHNNKLIDEQTQLQQLVDRMKTLWDDKQMELDAKERDLVEVQEKCASLHASASKASEECVLLKRDNSELRAQVEALTKVTDNLRADISVEVSKNEANLGLCKKVDELEQEVRIAEQKAIDDQDTIKRLENRCEEIEKELEAHKQSHQEEMCDLREIEAKYKSTLDENHNLKEEVSQLERLQEIIKSLNDELESKTNEIKEAREEIFGLRDDTADLNGLKEANRKLAEELAQTRYLLGEVSVEKQAAEEQCERFKAAQNSYDDLVNSNENNGSRVVVLENEIAKLTARNVEISSDNQQLIRENDRTVIDLVEVRANHEQLLTKVEDLIGQNEALTAELEQNGKLQGEFAQITAKYERLLEETNALKSVLLETRTQSELLLAERTHFETQLNDVERHRGELLHEKQLLHDEIAELKTSPLNLNGGQEIDGLREKLARYKSIDVANRSSIEFYEDELQKLRNKNEKLNRKLDETLVTLNHCTELSSSTEVEYLKNVLYNYMLGKESVVMARVLAAVCKFDAKQTEAVLKHEQHKQSLLGQLGIL